VNPKPPFLLSLEFFPQSLQTLAPAIFKAVAAGRPRVLGVAEEVRLIAYFISREGIEEG
jgi:hypothetical protein